MIGRRAPRRTAVVAGALVVVLILAVAAVAWILVPTVYEVPPPSGDRAVDATDRATSSQAIVTTRASILAALAGLGALVTIFINYRNSAIANRNAGIAAETLATTNRTFEITARGHLTDRYTAAIQQLGDKESLAIRLGGIYALQQFAVETDRDEDQTTVVEVLSAFVRTGLPRRVPEDVSGAPGGTGVGTGGDLPVSEPAPDVLAAISALAQLPGRTDLRADFSGVDFRGVGLSRARLRGANLRGVYLEGAVLAGADLDGAYLRNTDLRRADITGANVAGADLSGARLTEARLGRADLAGADLSAADLYEADLTAADLRDTVLRDATLRGATLVGNDLTEADLTDADLTAANLNGARLRADQLSAAQRRSAVNVPEPLDRYSGNRDAHDGPSSRSRG